MLFADKPRLSVCLEMFGSCVVLIIAAALYEGLKVFREWLVKRSTVPQCNGQPLAVSTVEETVNSDSVTSRKFSPKHSFTLAKHPLNVLRLHDWTCEAFNRTTYVSAL